MEEERMAHDGRNHGEAGTQRGRRVCRWGATFTAVAVAVVLTSCSSAPTPTASVATKTATSAAPEVTAAATETAAPTGNADITFNVEANKHSTYEQFVTRPRAERLAFAWDNYMLQITDGISSDFLTAVPYGGSGTLDKYNPAWTRSSIVRPLTQPTRSAT
jgi:hypothetical protein